MNIYKITNLINNKIYIGKTTQSYKRLLKRYNDEVLYVKNNRPIINAIRKYGIVNFQFEIISSCLNLQFLNELEINTIKQYNSTNHSIGYNITPGGDGISNPSPELRYKMGKGTREFFNKNGHGVRKGHKISEKQKIRLREVRLGKSPTNKGVKMTEAQKEVQRKSSKSAKSIIAVNLDSGIVLEFNSIKNAAKELKTTRETIKANLNGLRKNKNWHFLYKF